MNQLERIQRSLQKKVVPRFEIGDTVRVHVKVVEGEKERIQVYEGAVIARKGSLNTEMFTVRKVSYGVGVERIFPVHSPIVTKIDVVTGNELASWIGSRPSGKSPARQAVLSTRQEGQVLPG